MGPTMTEVPILTSDDGTRYAEITDFQGETRGIYQLPTNEELRQEGSVMSASDLRVCQVDATLFTSDPRRPARCQVQVTHPVLRSYLLMDRYAENQILKDIRREIMTELNANPEARAFFDQNPGGQSLGITAGQAPILITALVDTGSDISCITPALAERIGMAVIEWDDQGRIQTAGPQDMHIIGYGRALLCLGGNTYPGLFLVPAEHGEHYEHYDMIIGNDMIHRVGEITFDQLKRTLTFRDRRSGYRYPFKLANGSWDCIVPSLTARQLRQQRRNRVLQLQEEDGQPPPDQDGNGEQHPPFQGEGWSEDEQDGNGEHPPPPANRKDAPPTRSRRSREPRDENDRPGTSRQPDREENDPNPATERKKRARRSRSRGQNPQGGQAPLTSNDHKRKKGPPPPTMGPTPFATYLEAQREEFQAMRDQDLQPIPNMVPDNPSSPNRNPDPDHLETYIREIGSQLDTVQLPPEGYVPATTGQGKTSQGVGPVKTPPYGQASATDRIAHPERQVPAGREAFDRSQHLTENIDKMMKRLNSEKSWTRAEQRAYENFRDGRHHPVPPQGNQVMPQPAPGTSLGGAGGIRNSSPQMTISSRVKQNFQNTPSGIGKQQGLPSQEISERIGKQASVIQAMMAYHDYDDPRIREYNQRTVELASREAVALKSYAARPTINLVRTVAKATETDPKLYVNAILERLMQEEPQTVKRLLEEAQRKPRCNLISTQPKNGLRHRRADA